MRQSNIELLRVISIFMILIFHSNFLTLGEPTHSLLDSNPLLASAQLMFNSFTVICVDIFVLISGWFGIRPKLKGFLKFIFLCLFFSVSIYIVALLTGDATLNVHGVKGCLYMLPLNNWFIRAYLCLYIISPLINAFIDSSNERMLRNFLICFFLFQTLYVWLTGAALFFRLGYSTMSFIGLYSLSRYVRLYPSKLVMYKKEVYLIGYILISLFLMVCSFSIILFDRSTLLFKVFGYTNPLVIISSLSLLLYFSKLKINSRLINWLAASSFAAYLLHANPNIFSKYFASHIRLISSLFNGIDFSIVLLLYLVGVFISAVLIDQIRIFCWNKVCKLIK